MNNPGRIVMGISLVAAAIVGLVVISQAQAGRGNGPIVYVTGQNLFYDSIITADPIPPRGRFQKLEMTGPSGLQTEFGPGDAGYLGGRWWVDENNNNEMDDRDAYFSCPLLGPGREQQ